MLTALKSFRGHFLHVIARKNSPDVVVGKEFSPSPNTFVCALYRTPLKISYEIAKRKNVCGLKGGV